MGEQATRILIVDDEEGIRRLYLRLVKRVVPDAEVVLAVDGQEGIDILDSQPPFDLVISDSMMPKVGGMELLRHIYRTASNTPFILISGSLEPGQAEEAATFGARAVLEKPVSPKSLIDHFRDLLGVST